MHAAIEPVLVHVAEEPAFAEQHNVLLEGERHKFLRLAATDLHLALKSEDVVSDDVPASVVLVIAAILRVVDEIVFPHDARAALVIIHAPAAVAQAADVVHVAAADDRARLRPERVHRAHVAQLRPAEMMQMAIFDGVARARRRPVAPSPPDAHRAVEKIADVAMPQRAVARVEDERADASRKYAATGLDDAVIHEHMVRVIRAVLRHAGVADFHTARAEVVDVAFAQRDVAAPATEPRGVRHRVRKFAILERNVARAVGLDRCDELRVRLAEERAALGSRPRLMFKVQPAESQLAHDSIIFRIAAQHDPLRHDRRPHIRDRLALARDVKQLALVIEEPLARRIERGSVVFQPQIVKRRERKELALERPGELQRAVGVRVLHAVPRHVPREIDVHIHLAFFLRGKSREILGKLRLDAQQRLARIAGGLRVMRRFLRLAHRLDEALIRGPRPRRALAIYPQSLEAPRGIHLRGPHPVLHRAFDFLATRDDHFRTCIRFVSHTTVLRLQHDRLRDRIRARRENHARLAPVPRHARLAHRIARTGECRLRAIATILSIRRDAHGERMQWVRRDREDAREDEAENFHSTPLLGDPPLWQRGRTVSSKASRNSSFLWTLSVGR